MKRNSKIALVIIIVLIILGIVVGGLYLLKSKKILKQAGKPNQENSIISNSNQENNLARPAPQEVSIKNITIHTGSTYDQLPNGRRYESDSFQYAQGHYLIWSSPDYGNGKLTYDGQEVSVDQGIDKMYKDGAIPIGISRNGLHYVYVIRNDTSDDLYIDGKKVATDIAIMEPAVTDDGQHYFYISQTVRQLGHTGNILKKDGVQIYSQDAGGIFSYQIGFDGQDYLLEGNTVVSGNKLPGVSVFLNGKLVLSRDSSPLELLISNNGKHYGYILAGATPPGGGYEISNEELYIDGKKVLDSKRLYSLQVTDSGGYAVSAPNDKFFYTSIKTIPLKLDSSNTGMPLALISEDMNHYLVEDSSGLSLDGKPIELKGGYVELTDNTVFEYEVIQ